MGLVLRHDLIEPRHFAAQLASAPPATGAERRGLNQTFG